MTIPETIIILGCQRSGTTLTGNVIGGHPDTFLIDENEGVYDWFNAIAKGKDGDQEVLDSIVQKAAGKYLDARKSIKKQVKLEFPCVLCPVDCPYPP